MKKCPFTQPTFGPMLWNNPLQRWDVKSYDSVKHVLTNKDFVAQEIAHDENVNLEEFTREHQLHRKEIIRILRSCMPFFIDLASQNLQVQLADFKQGRKTDLSKDLVIPFCKKIAHQFLGISESVAKTNRLYEDALLIFNMTEHSPADIFQGQEATQRLARFFSQMLQDKVFVKKNELLNQLSKNKSIQYYNLSFLVQMYTAMVSSVPILLSNTLYHIMKETGTPSQLNFNTNEMIRVAGPSQFVLRVCAKETTVEGNLIKKGDQLALYLASANRDRNIFKNPENLNLEHNKSPNMSLGMGIHACFGGSLIRELETIFINHFKIFPLALEIDTSKIEYGGTQGIQGIVELPVIWNSDIH